MDGRRDGAIWSIASSRLSALKRQSTLRATCGEGARPGRGMVPRGPAGGGAGDARRLLTSSGKNPATIPKMQTPRLHTSARKPSYGIEARICRGHSGGHPSGTARVSGQRADGRPTCGRTGLRLAGTPRARRSSWCRTRA
eukprot:scaffold120342_cov26-Tisochrysis_lutea.AAC.2